jgi:hypothetical protein
MSVIFLNPLIISTNSIQVTLGIKGKPLENIIAAEPIQLTLNVVGKHAPGQFIDYGPIEITLGIDNGYVTLDHNQSNWIKWSKIGRIDFTIDESGVAGERPLDWPGTVYEIKKLGNDQLVIYGTNGISILRPFKLEVNKSTSNFGLETINRQGIVCKTAIVGDSGTHYFIENGSFKLFKLSTKGLELLDYSEFLSQLTNPVMTLDYLTGLLYICDGIQGFVYSTLFQSFSQGPAYFTGMGIGDGKLYVTSSSTIKPQPFEICTDIYDFNSRKPKTIQYVEVGTNLMMRLLMQIDTRLKNNEDWKTTPWKLVNPDGTCRLPCYGVEFRFRLKSLIYEQFKLDYIRITGAMHGFDSLNSVQ